MFPDRFEDKELEDVGCPTCGENVEKKLIHKYRNISFFCCQSCNINYATPRLVEKELLKLYEGDDWENYDNYSTWNFHDWINSDSPSFHLSRLNLELVENFLPKGSRILDVGCNIGLNIRLLNENGYPSKGVEVSSIGSKIANEIIGVDVENLQLKDCNYHKKFDGVMLMDVLEHLYQPLETLKEINSALKPPGYVFIHVPHHAGISTRWKKFLHKIHYKKSFKHFGFPAHLYGFDKTSLEKILHAAGFEAIHFESWPNALTTNKINIFNFMFIKILRKFALTDYILCVAKKVQKV